MLHYTNLHNLTRIENLTHIDNLTLFIIIFYICFILFLAIVSIIVYYHKKKLEKELSEINETDKAQQESISKAQGIIDSLHNHHHPR